MIVLGVPVVEVVDRSSIELKTLQQTGLHEFTQRSIHGCRTDVLFLALFRQSQHQFVSIKMLMLFEDNIDQEFPLSRLSLSPGLKIFFEPRHWRHRNGKWRQGLTWNVHRNCTRIG
jgi:hypothetical protein